MKAPRQFSSRWFRMYSEVVDDPKIQMLGDKLGFFWMNCMCLASKGDGFLPPVGDIAWKLRKKETEVASMLASLYERGLLDQESDTFKPHNWDDRQFQSDFSKERVERYRERVKAGGAKVGGYLKHKAFVFDRDGSTCVYCSSTDRLVLDHMVPVIAGGDDDPMNLCCACKRCNSGKAGRTPEEANMLFVTEPMVALYQKNKERLLSRSVTVTVTPPDQNRSEQIRTDTQQQGKRLLTVSPSSICAPPENPIIDVHPATAAAIRQRFEDTDDAFIRALITKCAQEVLSAGEELDVLTDEVLAYAVNHCTKPKQQSAGLYLTTVPNWIKNKASTEGKEYAQ